MQDQPEHSQGDEELERGKSGGLGVRGVTCWRGKKKRMGRVCDVNPCDREATGGVTCVRNRARNGREKWGEAWAGELW